MGGGIAMCFANAGIPVTILETSEEALKRGLDIVAKNYQASAKRGGLSSEDVDIRLGLMTGTTDAAALGRADMVIEAVFEDMDVKRDVFGKLDQMSKPDAILATNTSYLDVNEIAHFTHRPESVLGMHFFSPANVMRLLEIVRGADTKPELLATAISVARKIGKVPVVVGVCHGFVGNRILRVRSTEAERLLLEGALPQDIDGALTSFGFPLGPFGVTDLAGLDISWRMRKAQGARAEIADQLCEMGRFGQKTGKGFYLYEAGSRTPKPDPEVEALIVATSQAPRHRTAQFEPRRDHRAAAVSDDQRRRAHPRGGYRAAPRRYRRDLGLWLRLPGLARRPHVLCRSGWTALHSRQADRIRQDHRRQEARAGTAAREARE